MEKLYYLLTGFNGTPWQLSIHMHYRREMVEEQFQITGAPTPEEYFLISNKGHFNVCFPYQGGFRNIKRIFNIENGEYDDLAKYIEYECMDFPEELRGQEKEMIRLERKGVISINRNGNHKDLFFIIHENFKDVVPYIAENTDYGPVSCGTLD